MVDDSDHISELEVREYQVAIANFCINKNSLVVLPTGLGKTIIAVLVAKKALELFPPESKIIVLAPTRPLINQHYDTFLKFLNIPEDNFVVLTGKTLPEKRTELYHHNQILFYTPQTLRNDLVSRRYTLEDTALIIFDEAHHASGEYAYIMIADEYSEQNPDGTTLALTASPGASKKKIAQLCTSLHIPLENIHIRTRKDEDVKSYLKPMNIYKIGVNLTGLMAETYSVLTSVLEERLHYLSQLGFLDGKADLLHEKVFRKDLLRLNKELVSILKSSTDKTGVYSALSINAQALIVYHMLELIEQQGLDVLLIYLEKLRRDQKKKASSKAVKILASDSRIHRVFIELKKNEDLSPENLIHPKYHILHKVLTDELTIRPEARILVFVKLRDSLKTIVKRLSEVEGIHPIRFVGQATKSEDDKGLSQKMQIEILEEFRKGIYNVLVSTNVGEEGLDIAECDLVVFYDVVASEIRLIQRKGRTARHREGKVIILYCKGTHDEIYLHIALNKLKKMNTNLKSPQQLNKESDLKFTSKTEESIKILERISPTLRSPPQASLEMFTGPSPPPIRKEPDIKLGKSLPMKLGLRKKLRQANISFSVVDSDLHITIQNKVLLQVYNPRDFISSTGEISDLKEICKLLIVLVDFIDFEEQHAGEKHKLQSHLQKMNLDLGIQILPIYNEEEVYFIIQSILETKKEVG
ncbi:MAG: DEAD/DEAH box helicase [Promethearchaeota archaeon]